MSYDVSLATPPCEHCGQFPDVPEIGNMTYNVRPMYEKAMGVKSITQWNGKKAKEVIFYLEAGCLDMYQRPHIYQELEPDNGWGTHKDALEFLEKFRYACQAYPEATVEVH